MILGYRQGISSLKILIPATCKRWELILHIKIADGDLDGAFYYQTGKNKDAESVSAFMASATAAYAFNKTWGMVVSFDYLSGNEEGQ